MQYDLVVTGGVLVDGLNVPRRRADVAVKNGVIAAIGDIPVSDATEVLDASGMIVAPGFIDLHTHYDAQLFWDPWRSLSGWHGVTSLANPAARSPKTGRRRPACRP
jgi:N-acyl-D-amino-acid deacylase